MAANLTDQSFGFGNRSTGSIDDPSAPKLAIMAEPMRQLASEQLTTVQPLHARQSIDAILGVLKAILDFQMREIEKLSRSSSDRDHAKARRTIKSITPLEKIRLEYLRLKIRATPTEKVLSEVRVVEMDFSAAVKSLISVTTDYVQQEVFPDDTARSDNLMTFFARAIDANMEPVAQSLQHIGRNVTGES